MFEMNPHPAHPIGFFDRPKPTNDQVELVYRAVNLFNTALARGRFARVKHLFMRTPSRLLDLNDLPSLHMRAQHYEGLRTVALKNICGTSGRTTDFDIDFNPLDSRLRDRWQSIAMAFLYNAGLQLVELVRVGDCYFVLDGHHRISVARALGQCAIDAEVTAWEIPQTFAVKSAQPAGARVATANTFS